MLITDNMRKTFWAFSLIASLLVSCERQIPQTTEDNRSPQEILFEDGNYAMFIHFGLYSSLEGVWKGKI